MTSDSTIMTSGHHGSIRTTFISNNSITPKNLQQEHFWILPSSGYSIRETENLSMKFGIWIWIWKRSVKCLKIMGQLSVILPCNIVTSLSSDSSVMSLLNLL